MKSIVGVYETPQETIAAIEGLLTKGYDSDDISVVTSRSEIQIIWSHVQEQKSIKPSMHIRTNLNLFR